jgi:hypothetical protein
MGRAVVQDGEQTIETWTAIFQHLQDKEKDPELDTEDGEEGGENQRH